MFTWLVRKTISIVLYYCDYRYYSAVLLIILFKRDFNLCPTHYLTGTNRHDQKLIQKLFNLKWKCRLWYFFDLNIDKRLYNLMIASIDWLIDWLIDNIDRFDRSIDRLVFNGMPVCIFSASNLQIHHFLCKNRIHRPVALSIGLIFMSIGCTLFFLPQFIAPPYRPDLQNLAWVDGLCDGNRSSTCEVNKDTESLSYLLPVFIVARFLTGMGGIPIYTIGLNHMDDCSNKEKFAKYCGNSNAGTPTISEG